MLVNEHFNEFPIDYFKLEVNNFIDPRGFEDAEQANLHLEDSQSRITKEVLFLNPETGYIGEDLAIKLDLNTKNTSVINCAVGQGKTTAVLNILQEYFSDDANADTFFIIAVPLVSLISQYRRDLIALGFTDEDIFSYENLGKSEDDGGLDYRDGRRRIHLVTVNTLLGNPGEKAVMQSKVKNKYLKEFSDLLDSGKKKLIIIYDEIHEAIKSFSPMGEIHLHFFAHVLQKNIVLSATYNIQSVGVIKMLSRLTEDKIQILESDRVVVKEQSELHLHYNNFYHSRHYGVVKRLVRKLLREDKTIDILSYSKNLCKSLLNPEGETGGLLTDKFGPLRDCTSNLDDNQPTTDEDISVNRFSNDFCNIGTNFKSGVSIAKENHAFVIILPPRYRGSYSSSNGIFTEGINSVIQAVARQRTVGEIHIILPSPIWMDGDTLVHMDPQQKEAFMQEYIRIGRDPGTIRTRNNIRVPYVKFIPFAEHYNIVHGKWALLVSRLLKPYFINENLEFPSIYKFIHEKGELVLTNEGFLGKDLASFVTYSAFTNQFYNARLASYEFQGLTNQEIVEALETAYEEHMSIEGFEEAKLSHKYVSLRDHTMGSLSPNLGDYEKSKIRHKVFKFILDKEDTVPVIPGSIAMKYLFIEYNNFNDNSTDERRRYSEKMKYFINKVLSSKQISDSGITYFKKFEDQSIFTEDELEELLQLIQEIRRRNPALMLTKSKFFRGLSADNVGQKFYDFVLKSFFHTQRYQPIESDVQMDYRKVIRSVLTQNLL